MEPDTTSDTTGMPKDTMPDTTQMSVPCDPDLVYFDLQVLPVLRSSCASPGCHDSIGAAKGIVLNNYDNVLSTAEVEPYNLEGGKLYKILEETDDDKRMPPPPKAPLKPEFIQLIAKWILQGAQKLECDPDAEGCDTEDVRFSTTIWPVIQSHCTGCHSGPTPTGGVLLDNYSNIKKVADDGRLFGVTNWADGYKRMPFGGKKLDPCTLEKINTWLESGAPDN